MKKLFFTILTMALLGSTQAQNMLNLYPDYDAALGIHDGVNTGTINYGSAIQNSAYCINSTANSGQNKNRALIHFDLSQIAPGTAIASATLDLHALGVSGNLNGHTGTANEAWLSQVTSPWQEMVVTWASQPTYSGTNRVALAASNTSTQDYLGINVTALVQDMVDNPASNYGFGFMLQNEQVTNALLFASNDHPDSNMRPRLHVTLCQNVFNVVASDDAAIGSHSGLTTANNNYGTAPQNAAYSITANNSTPSGNNNRALMHFDLSAISTTANISSATLKLYARGQNGTLNGHTGTANASYIARVTSAWNANTVTWNSQPSFVLTDAATLSQSTNALEDYLNIDVTAMVQDMVANPSTNNGFLLKLINEVENNGLIFQSLDCGDSTKFPTLTVNVICGELTGVKDQVEPAFATVALYPNPTQGKVSLRVDMIEAAQLSVKLYDLSGRLLAEQNQGQVGTGGQDIALDQLVANRPAGIYIVSVLMGEHKVDRKLVLTDN
jgi:hypothetical protein